MVIYGNRIKLRNKHEALLVLKKFDSGDRIGSYTKGRCAVIDEDGGFNGFHADDTWESDILEEYPLKSLREMGINIATKKQLLSLNK